MYDLYTIGHSTHTVDRFIELIRMHLIAAVCDVRSNPYSKFNPQYNRENIQRELKKNNISYVFLGKELGPRSDDPECYVDGKVQYDRLAKTALFKQGINRLKDGIASFRIALMCAEKDPVMCHRTILVCRQLRSEDIGIYHILEDGSLEENSDLDKRLMKMLRIPQLQLFESTEELVERAYQIQGQKIAYSAVANDRDEITEEETP